MSTRISLHSPRQNISANDSNTSHIGIKSSTDKLKVTVQNSSPMNVSLRDVNTTRFNMDIPVRTSDYNALTNLPTLNGVTIRGNLISSDLFLPKESVNTKEYWNSQLSYIPDLGEIVIYTNRNTVDNVDYPGIKIGDGNAYLVDLPFVGDELYTQIITAINEHVQNTSIHVTSEEKEFWNNKLNCNVENGNLFFNRL